MQSNPSQTWVLPGKVAAYGPDDATPGLVISADRPCGMHSLGCAASSWHLVSRNEVGVPRDRVEPA